MGGGLTRDDLAGLLNQAGVGLAVLRDDGEVRWLNDELARLLNLPAGLDAVGRCLYGLLPPNLDLRNSVDRVIRDGRSVELPAKRLGGAAPLPALGMRLTPLRLAGEPAVLLAARELPTELEAYLTAVVEHMPAGVLVAEAPSGRLLGGNHKLEEILGHSFFATESPADYAAQWRLHRPDGRRYGPGEDPLGRSILHGEVVKEEEVVVFLDDGREVTILASASPIRDASGRTVAGVLVVADVTERKRAAAEREALIARERRHATELQLILDSLPDGLVIYGPDHEIRRMNPEAERVLGLSEEERRRPLHERFGIVHLETIDGEWLALERSPMWRATRGEVVAGEVYVLRRDGAAAGRRIRMSAAPIRDEAGAVVGVVNLFTDVTRMHELQERLEDLVRAISHDVRAPLNAIFLQAQLLERAPETAAAAGRILRCAGSINAMIESLVVANRIEAQAVAPRPTAVSLRALGMALRDGLHGVIDERRVRIMVPDDLPPLWCDPDHLERVLTNLVTNGLKYSPPEGEVVLDGHLADGEVEITVSDRGPGIAREKLHRIFDRFYRGDARPGTEGLGLGLFIARALVQANRGRISVESEPGKGSTFRVALPRAAQAPEPRPQLP